MLLFSKSQMWSLALLFHSEILEDHYYDYYYCFVIIITMIIYTMSSGGGWKDAECKH